MLLEIENPKIAFGKMGAMKDPYLTPEYKDLVKEHTIYEWLWEEVDEHGDIQDLDHAQTLAEIRRSHPVGRYGLVRDVGSEAAGLQDRQWAYLDVDGNLPLEFDGGSKIPARFHKETASMPNDERTNAGPPGVR